MNESSERGGKETGADREKRLEACSESVRERPKRARHSFCAARIVNIYEFEAELPDPYVTARLKYEGGCGVKASRTQAVCDLKVW
jgi:hypothetical protein